MVLCVLASYRHDWVSSPPGPNNSTRRGGGGGVRLLRPASRAKKREVHFKFWHLVCLEKRERPCRGRCTVLGSLHLSKGPCLLFSSAWTSKSSESHTALPARGWKACAARCSRLLPHSPVGFSMQPAGDLFVARPSTLLPRSSHRRGSRYRTYGIWLPHKLADLLDWGTGVLQSRLCAENRYMDVRHCWHGRSPSSNMISPAKPCGWPALPFQASQASQASHLKPSRPLPPYAHAWAWHRDRPNLKLPLLKLSIKSVRFPVPCSFLRARATETSWSRLLWLRAVTWPQHALVRLAWPCGLEPAFCQGGLALTSTGTHFSKSWLNLRRVGCIRLRPSALLLPCFSPLPSPPHYCRTWQRAAVECRTWRLEPLSWSLGSGCGPPLRPRACKRRCRRRLRRGQRCSQALQQAFGH